jgi:hypothetical protein
VPVAAFGDNIYPMNQKTRDFINGLGLVAAAVAMMAVGIGFIFLVYAVFHIHSK